MDTKDKHCLNCGSKLYEGNYCHICGQDASTGRLTVKKMSVAFVSGMTRLNGPFLNTVRTLIIKPWRVVSDYIHGRRAPYTAPVQLLILLTFFTLIVSSMMDGANVESGLRDTLGHIRIVAADGQAANVINTVCTYLFTSLTWIYILIVIPAIPALYIVHRLAGIRKFNMAEYLVGGIYMSCFVLLVGLIIKPFDILFGYQSMPLYIVKFIFLFSILFIAIYKSFRSSNKRWAVKIAFIALFVLLTLLAYLLAFVALVAIHVLSAGQ